MPKVQAVVDGVRYGGKTYNFGDEFEATTRHAKLLRVMKKIGPVQPQTSPGTALETLPAFADTVPVPPPEETPSPSEPPSRDEPTPAASPETQEQNDGQANEEQDGSEENRNVEGIVEAEQRTGQTGRAPRGTQRSRPRS